MRYLYISSLFAALCTSILLGAPALLYAESQVFNSFSVESHTGGNTASNGETVTGSSYSSVDITTIINGEIVEDIHEESHGEPIHIERTTTASTSRATVTTRIDMQSSTDHESGHGSTTPGVTKEPLGTSTTSFTNIDTAFESAEDLFEDEDTILHPLFSSVYTALARTFTYVLSNIFGYPISNQ